MSAGIILDDSAPTSARTRRGPTSAAAPLASNLHMMAGTAKVKWRSVQVFSFDICRWWALRKCKQARKEHFAGVLTDVNECDNNPCSQECANVYGSYQCYCRRGYQLSDLDGITCEGSVELHSLWVLTINGFRLLSLCLSASPQTLMSALCLPEVTCAPTAAPTARGVFTVPARPQATPSAPMDVHAKVGGSNCRNSA